MAHGHAELLQLARDEQSDLVNMAQDLGPDEWQSPALCAGLSVRDVLLHVAAHIHHDPSVGRVALVAATCGFSVVRTEKRIDEEQGRRFSDWSTTTIVGRLDEPITIGSRLTRMFPKARLIRMGLDVDALIQLSEMMIHQQDVRRPLARVRTIPPDRVQAALDFTGAVALVMLGAREEAGRLCDPVRSLGRVHRMPQRSGDGGSGRRLRVRSARDAGSG
jgi:uncharacterized protein (TIGR03083 family)